MNPDPKAPEGEGEEQKPEETKEPKGGFERVTEIPPAFRLDRDVFSDE